MISLYIKYTLYSLAILYHTVILHPHPNKLTSVKFIPDTLYNHPS